MNVIADSDVNVRAWSDPLVDMHIDEFAKCASRSNDLKSLVGTADHLCELSRDLLYRLDHVTRRQLDRLIAAFSDAVKELRKGADQLRSADSSADAERIDRFICHIEKRILILKRI